MRTKRLITTFLVVAMMVTMLLPTTGLAVVVDNAVMYDVGSHGATTDTTEFYGLTAGDVLQDVAPEPTIDPDPGYEFDGWSPALPASVQTGTNTYTAQYIAGDNVVHLWVYVGNSAHEVLLVEIVLDPATDAEWWHICRATGSEFFVKLNEITDNAYDEFIGLPASAYYENGKVDIVERPGEPGVYDIEVHLKKATIATSYTVIL